MRKISTRKGDRRRSIDRHNRQQDLLRWHAGGLDLEKFSAAVRDGTVAVVITYHPDLTRLTENLDAVEEQVDAILVYCNEGNQTSGLTDLLKKYRTMYFMDQNNLGLSGPLNMACGTSRLLNAKYVLLLDQDSVPQKGMVKHLERCMTDSIGISCPQIVDRHKTETINYSEAVVRLARAITSGSLVNLEAWESVGGFDERLFVDWVDYEFSCALRTAGYCIAQVGSVYNLHEMGRREYVCTLPSLFGARRLYRVNHSKSRFEDKAHSWVITLHNYMPDKEGVRELVYILSIALRDIVLEKNRVATAEAFVKGVVAGRRTLRKDN